MGYWTDPVGSKKGAAPKKAAPKKKEKKKPGILADPYVKRAAEAHERRRVGRMKTLAPPAEKAPAPYTCGQPCGWSGPGATCASTVRGGICPCRCC